RHSRSRGDDKEVVHERRVGAGVACGIGGHGGHIVGPVRQRREGVVGYGPGTVSIVGGGVGLAGHADDDGGVGVVDSAGEGWRAVVGRQRVYSDDRDIDVYGELVRRIVGGHIAGRVGGLDGDIVDPGGEGVYDAGDEAPGA